MKGYISMKYEARLLSACLLATSLFGCGLMIYPDVNDDPAKNNKAAFQQDALDCAKAYPTVESGSHIKQRINCMHLKGWR